MVSPQDEFFVCSQELVAWFVPKANVCASFMRKPLVSLRIV